MTGFIAPERGAAAIPLADRAARGGAVTLGAEGVRVVIEMGGIVLLARLLTPDDFGLVAMVAAIIGLVSLSDFGLPAAAVQRAALTHDELSSLFWLNGAIGLSAAGLAAGAAPAIAWLYGEPRLVGITIALSSLFLLRGLSAQPAALLRRNLKFAALAWINIAAVAVGTAMAVFAAWRGAGFWALVVHQTGIALAVAAGLWWTVRWRPASPFAWVSVRRLLRFGSDVTAARFLQLMSRNLSQILIGAMSGAAVLGLYSNAHNLLFRPIMRFHTPLVPVASAVLARLADEPARYRAFFRSGNLALNSLTLPFLAFLAVDAAAVVAVFLGDRWLALLPLLRALLVAALVRALFMSTQWVYLSLGRTREQLRWAVARATLTVVGIGGGAMWGAIGIALGLSVASAVLLFPAISWAIGASPLRWSDFLASTARPAAAAVVAALTVLAAAPLLSVIDSRTVRLLFDGACFGATYASVWLLIPGGADVARTWLEYLRRSE